MSETATSLRPWALRRTVEAYSGGTRVGIIDWGGGKRVSVRVLATDEVIEVTEHDLVMLRSGSTVLEGR
jgi:hypothetical protein